MRAVPQGTPNPDGDRRFDERAFPLLEPVRWTGERHRGRYGTQEPGGITIALGLVFGPWDPFVSEPRLEVTVGNDFPLDINDEHAPMLAWRSRLVASRDALRSPPSLDFALVRGTETIDIEGRAVPFDLLHGDQRWLAQGRWRGYMVEVHAVCVEPASVHLQLAAEVPGR